MRPYLLSVDVGDVNMGWCLVRRDGDAWTQARVVHMETSCLRKRAKMTGAECAREMVQWLLSIVRERVPSEQLQIVCECQVRTAPKNMLMATGLMAAATVLDIPFRSMTSMRKFRILYDSKFPGIASTYTTETADAWSYDQRKQASVAIVDELVATKSALLADAQAPSAGRAKRDDYCDAVVQALAQILDTPGLKKPARAGRKRKEPTTEPQEPTTEPQEPTTTTTEPQEPTTTTAARAGRKRKKPTSAPPPSPQCS